MVPRLAAEAQFQRGGRAGSGAADHVADEDRAGIDDQPLDAGAEG